MAEIERLASLVVWRAFGFSWLAITMAMSGLLFDLALACLIGALLAIALALAFQLRAITYHRVRRITDTEVWILLDEPLRPPQAVARQLIVAAMRLELSQKALYAAAAAAGLLALSLILRLLLPV